MDHRIRQAHPSVSLNVVRWGLAAVIAVALHPAASFAQARELASQSAFDTAIAVGQTHRYTLRLRAGESVQLVVRQIGVDLVVVVEGPGNALPFTVDSPNGRNGDEPVEIVSTTGGEYRLTVRPYDVGEPAGRYRLEVQAWRDARATAALLRARELARDSASRWLSSRTTSLSLGATSLLDASIPRLDSLARRARVLGIGEATHGSREFGDTRVALTRRLVERSGYRVVAIEGSATRLALLNSYIAGGTVSWRLLDKPGGDAGWIGIRPLREIVVWLRQWNSAHPRDKVELVGVDPQDSPAAPDSLRAFLSAAYGPEVVTRLAPMFAELAAADSQTAVFGNSDVDSLSRASIMSLLAKLHMDAPMLSKKLGATRVKQAIDLTTQLAQFADFNSGGGFPASHSRDWYMATNLLAALDRAGPSSKAVFWAHNAHVWHPGGQSIGGRSSGAWLRESLRCDYAALGLSFNEGAFVAQIPNDSADRLAVSTLPAAPTESIEGVLSQANRRAGIAVWPCRVDPMAVPGWLRSAHPMHWVGGLYTPGSLPSEAFRAYNLVTDFDGVVFFPRVTADEMPRDRPLIPARKR